MPRAAAAPLARLPLASHQRLLAALALPTFGLALSITIVATYVPVLLRDFTTSGTLIGLVIGGEGVFALALPVLVGSWSDRVRNRFGRRFPFILAAAPVAAASLLLIPFVPSLAAIAGLILAFYVAYFTYYPPYRALYADVVPARLHGRAQGSQAVARGLGLGLALASGGVLLALWTPAPFVLGAAAIVGTTLALRAYVREPEDAPDCCPEGAGGTVTRARALLRDRADIRALLAANVLWELTLAALKTFIVLFLVVGLGRSLGFASGIIGVVAAASVVAALIGGVLADRYGLGRMMRIALWVYGVGLLVPVVTQETALVLPVFPLIAFGGAVVMTLPFGLLMGMMPRDGHGVASGLFDFSRGVGVLLGPIVAGASIDLLEPVFESTQGFAAMWLVAGLSILLSIPLMRKIAPAKRAAGVKAPAPATASGDGYLYR